jgi:hypothetical protein
MNVRLLRVPLVYRLGTWAPALPDYSMVPDSLEPVIPRLTTPNGVRPDADPNDPQLKDVSVLVQVPADQVDDQLGAIDRQQIRVRYLRGPDVHPTDPRYSPDADQP